jgi:hypothetical protein
MNFSRNSPLNQAANSESFPACPAKEEMGDVEY